MKSLYQDGWRVHFFNGSFGWIDNEAGARYAQEEQGLKVEPWQVVGATFGICNGEVRAGGGRPRVIPDIVVDAPFKGGWRVIWRNGDKGWTEDRDRAWQWHNAGYSVQPWAVKGEHYETRRKTVEAGGGTARPGSMADLQSMTNTPLAPEVAEDAPKAWAYRAAHDAGNPNGWSITQDKTTADYLRSVGLDVVEMGPK